ncbi:MAG TPA: hypothetical protein VMF69_05390 [Gemmataceae bacterium]|nr:hypothetical protein [Gemmataceae bacterium]
MGAAGPAILFVLSLAASIMVGVCVLPYAARCVLVIVQETGLGEDEIIWPNEPYVDWLGHAVQFIELVGIWLAPAALMARLLRHVWLPDEGALRVLLLAGPGLWLFFPIGLLSSLSAQSRWVPFRWSIFICFLRIAPAALGFYAITAPLLYFAAVNWYYALFGGRGTLLPVAAVVSAAVLFIYSRLLGRLAWIIQRLPPPRRTPANAKAPKHPQPQRKKKRKPSSGVKDPWAVPEEEERAHETSKRFPWMKEQSEKPKSGYQPPSAEEIEGYGFAKEQPAPPEKPPEKLARSRFARSPEEYEPYEMRDIAKAETSTPREPQSELFAEQVRQRIAERTRSQPKPPPHPFFSGVYNFPLYSACLPNWLALSLAFLAEGGIVYLLLEFGSNLFRG